MPDGTVSVNDSGPKAVDCEAIVRDDGSVVERQRVSRVDEATVIARRQAEVAQLAPVVDAELAVRRHAERGSNLADRRGRTGRGVR